MGVILTHQRFLERLQEAAERGRAQVQAAYQQQGLTSSQFALLEAIAAFQPQGCAQTELATRLNLAESTLSVQVERLHCDGWLHRLRSKQDRRRCLLVLTTAGQTRLAAAQTAVEAVLAEWLDGWSLERLDQVADVLEQLVRQHRQHLRWSSAAAPAALQRDEWGSHDADPRLREAG